MQVKIFLVLIFLLFFSVNSFGFNILQADDFLKETQNIQENEWNNIDEIYYKVLALKEIEYSFSLESKTKITAKIDSFKNKNGGYGHWVNDRPSLDSTLKAIESLNALNISLPDENALKTIQFIYSLQISSSGFTSNRFDKDADVISTYNAIKALVLLNGEVPEKNKIINFLQDHQNKDGGFGLQTRASKNIFWSSTVTSTHRAIKALALLEAEPLYNGTAISFLRSLQTSDGGFKKDHGSDSVSKTGHSYNAIEALKILGSSAIDESGVILFIENNQHKDGGYGKTSLSVTSNLVSTYFAEMLLISLNKPVSNKVLGFLLQNPKKDGGFGKEPGSKSTIRHTFNSVIGLNLIGKRPLNPKAAAGFINSFQNPDGGFGISSASNVQDTYRAVYSLQALGVSIKNKSKLVDFVKSLQNIDGGFGITKNAPSTLFHSHRAIMILELFGGKPKNKGKAIEYIINLQNFDGGFGGFPKDISDATTTYRAIEALNALDAAPKNQLKAINYLKSLQNVDGGFRRHLPESTSFNVFTYASILGLLILGEKPINEPNAIRYIEELRNPDLAFAEHPFFTSASDETYTAILTFLSLNSKSNSKPNLRNPDAEPVAGSMEHAFNFNVVYFDQNLQMPKSVYLVLNREKFLMNPKKNLDFKLSDGKEYSIVLTRMTVGEKNYFFEASDGISVSRTSEKQVFVSSIGSAPELLSPLVVKKDDVYIFSVIYQDKENKGPDYIKVEISGERYNLIELNKSDLNFTDGKKYSFSIKLSSGNYFFKFIAKDGNNFVSSSLDEIEVKFAEIVKHPDSQTLANIKNILKEKIGVNTEKIKAENVLAAVCKGEYCWKLPLEEGDFFFSKDGSRIIGEQEFNFLFLIPVIIASAIIFIIYLRRS